MPHRSIRLVTTPGQPRNHAPGMANRALIEPGHWADFDPFLLLMEDWMREPGGFPDHPHRGIETVTFVLDGHLWHADNRGNSGILTSDDVQWMTAGRGIVHAELPRPGAMSHTLQLWLNLPGERKMVESSYQDLLASDRLVVEDDHATIRLISGGLEGVHAPTRNQTPVQYLEVNVPEGGRVAVPVPASHNGFIYVLDGAARFGAEAVPGAAGQVLWLDYPLATDGSSTLDVVAEMPTRLLLVTGQPLREPVVAYGPFVMNSAEQIHQAYRDFHSGLFGGPTPATMALAADD